MKEISSFNNIKDKISMSEWMKENNLTVSTPACTRIFELASKEFIDSFLLKQMKSFTGYDDVDRILDSRVITVTADLLRNNKEGTSFVESTIPKLPGNYLYIWSKLNKLGASFNEAKEYFIDECSDYVERAYSLNIPGESVRKIGPNFKFYANLNSNNAQQLTEMALLFKQEIMELYTQKLLDNPDLLRVIIKDNVFYSDKKIINYLNESDIIKDLESLKILNKFNSEDINLILKSYISYPSNLILQVIKLNIQEVLVNKTNATVAFTGLSSDVKWVQILSNKLDSTVFPIEEYFNYRDKILELCLYSFNTLYEVTSYEYVDRVVITYNHRDGDDDYKAKELYNFNLPYVRDGILNWCKAGVNLEEYDISFVWSVLYFILISYNTGAKDWKAIIKPSNQNVIKFIFNFYRINDNLSSALIRMLTFQCTNIDGFKKDLHKNLSNIFYIEDTPFNVFNILIKGKDFVSEIESYGRLLNPTVLKVGDSYHFILHKA